jgi:hypothetical protein
MYIVVHSLRPRMRTIRISVGTLDKAFPRSLYPVHSRRRSFTVLCAANRTWSSWWVAALRYLHRATQSMCVAVVSQGAGRWVIHARHAGRSAKGHRHAHLQAVHGVPNDTVRPHELGKVWVRGAGANLAAQHRAASQMKHV